MKTIEPPIVLVRRSPDGKTLVFDCDYCKETHRHGGQPGHRVAHCKSKSSPYYESGYNLKEQD